jgi:hypothetical protein
MKWLFLALFLIVSCQAKNQEQSADATWGDVAPADPIGEINDTWERALPAGAIKELGTIESGAGSSGGIRVRYWPEREEVYFQFEGTDFGDYGFSFSKQNIIDIRQAIKKYHSWKKIATTNQLKTRVEKTIIRLNAIEGWVTRNRKSYEIKEPIFELVFLYVEWNGYSFLIFRHGDLVDEKFKNAISFVESFSLGDFEVKQLEETISQKNLDLTVNIENLFQ